MSLDCRGVWVNVTAREHGSFSGIEGHHVPAREQSSLGSAVRDARRALGVTQDQLALTSGTNRRFIVELEQGKPTAQIGKVLSVLRTLGVSLALTPPLASAEKERGRGTTA